MIVGGFVLFLPRRFVSFDSRLHLSTFPPCFPIYLVQMRTPASLPGPCGVPALRPALMLKVQPQKPAIASV